MWLTSLTLSVIINLSFWMGPLLAQRDKETKIVRNDEPTAIDASCSCSYDVTDRVECDCSRRVTLSAITPSLKSARRRLLSNSFSSVTLLRLYLHEAECCLPSRRTALRHLLLLRVEHCAHYRTAFINPLPFLRVEYAASVYILSS